MSAGKMKVNRGQEILMKKFVFSSITAIWLIVLFSVGYAAGCEEGYATTGNPSCSDSVRVPSLYGTYRVFDVCKYGGGLVTPEEVKAYTEMDTVISETLFSIREHSINNPKYKLQCYYYPRPEGDIDPKRWSNFYGFSMDKRIIEVLEVYDLDHNPDRPFIYLEVINRNEIWSMSGGRLYKMKKVGKKETKERRYSSLIKG